MSTLKPVYSRPSDDAPTPAPKKHHRKRPHPRKGLHTMERPTATIQNDAVAEHHPTTTDDHHKRNRRTHHREKRRARELRAENERLHRRLAAIYDALTLD
ncbi:MAG: hypothetical protein KH404_05900 [Bifidobacterium pseudolongum]|nr:hypothetical protein [Bifidobacterium pseudolongum]